MWKSYVGVLLSYLAQERETANCGYYTTTLPFLYGDKTFASKRHTPVVPILNHNKLEATDWITFLSLSAAICVTKPDYSK